MSANTGSFSLHSSRASGMIWNAVNSINVYITLLERAIYGKLQGDETAFFNQYKITWPKNPLRCILFLKLIPRTYLISFLPISPFNHLSKDSRKVRLKTARLRDPRRLCGGERSSQNDSQQWVHSRCTCNLHWYNRGGISCQNPFARKFYSMPLW